MSVCQDSVCCAFIVIFVIPLTHCWYGTEALIILYAMDGWKDRWVDG